MACSHWLSECFACLPDGCVIDSCYKNTVICSSSWPTAAPPSHTLSSRRWTHQSLLLLSWRADQTGLWHVSGKQRSQQLTVTHTYSDPQKCATVTLALLQARGSRQAVDMPLHMPAVSGFSSGAHVLLLFSPLNWNDRQWQQCCFQVNLFLEETETDRWNSGKDSKEVKDRKVMSWLTLAAL